MLAATASAFLATAAAASAAPAIKNVGGRTEFVGTNMNFFLLEDRKVDVEAELAQAAAAGIQQVRFPLYWSSIQPYPSNFYDWHDLDGWVQKAADLHLTLLPVLTGAPEWASENLSVTSPETPTLIPARDHYDDFAKFAKALANRYGAGGTFASAATDPIRTWQIWNEPDHGKFWPQVTRSGCLSSKPGTPKGGRVWKIRRNGKTCWYSEAPRRWAPDYVALLKAARDGIKAGDSGAKAMMASFTTFAPVSATQVYNEIKSGRHGSTDPADYFDRMGINVFPSSNHMSDYSASVAKLVKAIKNAGDTGGGGAPRAPISLTEYSWLSGKGTITDGGGMIGFLLATPAMQGTYAAASLDYLARNARSMKIDSAFWYTWMTSDKGKTKEFVWEYAGLNCYDCGSSRNPKKVVRKPGLATFKAKALKLQGCKTKTVADACAS